jgi:hypothetical protein
MIPVHAAAEANSTIAVSPKHGGMVDAYTAAERNSAVAKLLNFSAEAEFQETLEKAFQIFWGDSLSEESNESLAEVMRSDLVRIAYIAWFVFDLDMDDGRTVVNSFLDREGEKLTAGERRYLEAARDTHLRLYEVLEIKPGQGLGLRDLWDEERLWFVEPLTSGRLHSGDVFVARVGRGADGQSVFEEAPYTFWPDDKDQLVKALRNAYRIFTVQFRQQGTANFFKHVAPLFHQWWLELVAFAPPPKIVADDGEPLIFAKVIFDLLDERTLTNFLKRHPEFVANSDGSYAWLEDAGGSQRCLGTIVVADHRIILETISRPRAERARDLLPSLFRQSIKFKVIIYEDVGQAVKRTPAPDKEEITESPQEVEPETLSQFYGRHYRNWLDEPVPALGNRTPRRAAKLKTARPKLIALLKDFERKSERQRRAGKSAYDFSGMWKELGLMQE